MPSAFAAATTAAKSGIDLDRASGIVHSGTGPSEEIMVSPPPPPPPLLLPLEVALDPLGQTESWRAVTESLELKCPLCLRDNSFLLLLLLLLLESPNNLELVLLANCSSPAAGIVNPGVRLCVNFCAVWCGEAARGRYVCRKILDILRSARQVTCN